MDTLYKANVELQFGSKENFETFLEASMTPERKKQIDEGIKQAVEQMKAGAGEETVDATGESTGDKVATALTQEEIQSFLGSTPTIENKK